MADRIELQFRRAVADLETQTSPHPCTADEVAIFPGATNAIFSVMSCLLDPGDEVLLPAPYWTTYPESIALAGGTPVVVPTSPGSGYRATVDQLEAARTPATKALVFVSPSNPTGAAYSHDALEALTEVLLRHPQVWVLTDDIYEHIVFDGFEFATPAAVEPELAERTLTMNGVSKAYAMTGWRLGYIIAPREFVRPIQKLQQNFFISANSAVQRAGLAALLPVGLPLLILFAVMGSSGMVSHFHVDHELYAGTNPRSTIP